jgi:hypothetical protein
MEVIWIDAVKQLEYLKGMPNAKVGRFIQRLATACLRANKRDLMWLNSLDFIRLVDPESKPQ